MPFFIPVILVSVGAMMILTGATVGAFLRYFNPPVAMPYDEVVYPSPRPLWEYVKKRDTLERDPSWENVD